MALFDFIAKNFDLYASYDIEVYVLKVETPSPNNSGQGSKIPFLGPNVSPQFTSLDPKIPIFSAQ
jgi:hypothetical protein